MIYDYIDCRDHLKWEHIWMRRPFEEKSLRYPLMMTCTGYGLIHPGWSINRQDNVDYGIEYVRRGNAVVIQNDRHYTINKGEVFLLPKKNDHSYTVGPAGILSKRFIGIDGIELDNILKSLDLWEKEHIVLKNPGKFEALLKKIVDMILRPPEVDREVEFSRMIYHMLLLLSQSIRTAMHPAIEKALAFMNENLHQSLTKKDICNHVGISISYFNGIFSRQFGCSPIAYFIRQKYNWAAKLLKTTIVSVKDIAKTVGIKDPLYFSAQFKKYFGISPKYFRSKDNKWNGM